MLCGSVRAIPQSLTWECEAAYRSGGGSIKFLMPRVGLVVPDATNIWLPLCRSDTAKGPCFTVELKPKQADKARSWLLEPGRASFKARFSRIQITRAATAGGKPQPAPEVYYEAIFSGDPKGMQRAIEASLNHQTGPVVNFFLDGTRMSPREHPGVAGVVTAALVREPILRRLRVAQQALDCLDIDGVTIALAAPQLVGLDIDVLLGCQPRTMKLSPHAEVAASMCRCPPGLLAVTTVKAREARRNLMIATLFKLSPQELLELLCVWLVALTLDDISVIVSTTRLTGPTKLRHQLPNLAGVLRTKENELHAYTVAIVDTGPKPTSKIKSKAEKEPKMIAHAKLALKGPERSPGSEAGSFWDSTLCKA